MVSFIVIFRTLTFPSHCVYTHQATFKPSSHGIITETLKAQMLVTMMAIHGLCYYTTTTTNRFTAIIHVTNQHLQLRTGGFRWCKVLLRECPC